MDDLTSQTVELLQTMIRNECVNDGTAESGHEVRNAETLQHFLEGVGLDFEQYEPTPGRGSIVCRIEGSDQNAPSLCLMGHTDVVPVTQSGWSRDPFGGELFDGEVWGRGAVDMLNLTSSMAVAFRHLAATGFAPKGDLIFFGVADEESGSQHGAQWMANHERDAIYADYVLTESGGLHSGSPETPSISVNVGEKGVAWRKLKVKGTPGHGSMPFRKDNALVRAAAVVQRISEYKAPVRFHELWRNQVQSMAIPDDAKAQLLDTERVDEMLMEMPNVGTASHLHSCTHTTFSANVIDGGHMKTNVIPDTVELNIDIRTMPGEDAVSVQAHLDAALGDLAPHVEVEIIMNDQSTMSRLDTPLWDSLQRCVNGPFPTATLNPQLTVGFTDARVYREMGSIAYGAGLFSPELNGGDFSRRFHGNDERIDIESLALTTQLWLDVVRDFQG
ncbi:MAG: M20/M25/M40 family metallo-hydrolase [Actinomycetota bacterium]|nr:M20/M25/M40 family metallo-hydrolase [Actinomycetota bacterium]